MNEIVSAKTTLEDDHSASRQLPSLIWYGTLFGPFLLTTTLLATLVMYGGWAFAMRLVANTVMALFLLGRFIILSGADDGVSDFHGSLSSLQLFLLVTYLDVMVASILAFHIGWLFRLPVIGPRAKLLVGDGEFILKSHPWMKRATFTGLIAFVGFPLAATGSVGGSIFGRMLGMGRLQTFAGIALGSAMGNGLMYWFSDLLGQWLDKDHPLVHYGGLLLIVVLVLVLERRYQMLKRKHFQHSSDSTDATIPPFSEDQR